MRRWLPLALFIAGIAGGGLLWSFLAQRPAATPAGGENVSTESSETAPESSLTVNEPPAQDLPDVQQSIEEGRRNAVVRSAEKVGPAVVSISVVQTRYVRGRVPADPFGFFFDRYLPGPIYKEQVPVLGSGVIIDRAGVVLTNEHVVRDAEQIKVTLTDGRTFDARLVGADSNYDLAVLKMAASDIPVAELGDSEHVMVGEWAIAIGNPFGFLLNEYQPSVSLGVISAKGRDIKQAAGTGGIYKNMIQTDAAINPGNSGGPLVNGEGKVIGINTFIFTESGGSLGIGFAIPINDAMRVVREILQYGKVRSVWTGIRVRPITPYLAAYFNIQDRRGLIVVELEEGSPADRAGIQVGDIIRKVNDEPVWSADQASRLIFGAEIGDRIRLAVEREGTLREISVRLEAEPVQREESR